MMSHIFAAHKEFEQMRRIRQKYPTNDRVEGRSEVQILGEFHSFKAGNGYLANAEYAKRIEPKLRQLTAAIKEKFGFEHDFANITRQIEDEETAQYEMERHSEKLALCYALSRLDCD